MLNFTELTVNVTLSPLQWGERPGNLRFSLYKSSEKIPVGSLSIGGMNAYRLQEKIVANGSLKAKVAAKGSKFVLTHIAVSDGWMPWKQAVNEQNKVKVKEQAVLVDEVVSLPMGRRVVIANRSRIETAVEI